MQGRCYTLGIELALASQVVVAASDTVFAQLEVARGIVPLGAQLDRALELANQIAQNAPLGVRAALASHRAAERTARDAAFAKVLEDARGLFQSQDVREAMAAMMERRPPKFQGR